MFTQQINKFKQHHAQDRQYFLLLSHRQGFRISATFTGFRSSPHNECPKQPLVFTESGKNTSTVGCGRKYHTPSCEVYVLYLAAPLYFC